MTVQELINALSELNPDMEIMVTGDRDHWMVPEISIVNEKMALIC